MLGEAIILSGYAALAVLAVALTLHAHRAGHRGSTPTAYVSSMMRYPTARWLILVLWLWVGWHNFVR
jgi:Family of unknown function (DUF6186)